MQICIDYREKALLERIPVTPKNLILGDIILEKEGKPVVLIERKTISDLSASICDGRYQEQSGRLMEYDLPKHHIIYIIEGSLDQVQSVPKKTLMSALISLWYKKGFTIFRSSSVDETVEYIHALVDKIQKEDTVHDSICIAKKKGDKLTPDTIDILMLSQIPTISAITAKALLGKYTTVFQLTTALKENNKCLDDFTYGEKSRKLSKKTIEHLLLFLHI
jgi:ERCC4-type nuclease